MTNQSKVLELEQSEFSAAYSKLTTGAIGTADFWDIAFRSGKKAALLAAQAEPDKAEWAALTDDDREEVFLSMPGGLDGFLKTWGWLPFAKAIEAKCREKNEAALSRAQSAAPAAGMTDERLLAAFNSADTVIDGLHEVARLLSAAPAAAPEASKEHEAIVGLSAEMDAFLARWRTCSIEEMRYFAMKLRIIAAAPQPVAAQVGGPESQLLGWAIERWTDEVANRPLINVYRRTLDSTWRQVIRYAGGDDVLLVGPRHDDLVAAAAHPQAGGEK